MFEGRSRPLAPPTVAILAIAGFTTWTALVAGLWANESRLVYQAHRTRYARIAGAPIEYGERVELKTSDGLYLEAAALRSVVGNYWILFFAPSAGSLRGLGGQLTALQSFGYNVFAFDYRGFGRNPGTPSEGGVYEDALTAYRHLRDQLGVEPGRIILAGRSLGSAVAVELATRVHAGGLLLVSAIDSVPATGSRLYPWAPVSLLASQRFDSMAKAQRVRVPVLLVHATDDRMVPIGAARALFRRFPGPKVMLELSGGHNDVGFAGGDSLSRALARFWSNPG
jgi:pimeloyl-ACP methyl ester carboxylesterase